MQYTVKPLNKLREITKSRSTVYINYMLGKVHKWLRANNSTCRWVTRRQSQPALSSAYADALTLENISSRPAVQPWRFYGQTLDFR